MTEERLGERLLVGAVVPTTRLVLVDSTDTSSGLPGAFAAEGAGPVADRVRKTGSRCSWRWTLERSSEEGMTIWLAWRFVAPKCYSGPPFYTILHSRMRKQSSQSRNNVDSAFFTRENSSFYAPDMYTCSC